MTTYETLSIIIGILTLVLVCIGFYVTNRTLRIDHDWNRRLASAEALNVISDNSRISDLELLNKAFNYTESNDPILMDLINSKTNEDTRVLQVLLLRLNMFEMFAIGVVQGVYDEEYIKSTIGPAMIKVFRRFHNFIEHHRKYTKAYCGNLERIALQWELSDKSNYKRKRTA